MARSTPAPTVNFPEVWMFWPSLNAAECDRYPSITMRRDGGAGATWRASPWCPSGALRRPLAGTVDGTIYEHENGWTDAGLPILGQRWIETGALGIGGGERLVDVTPGDAVDPGQLPRHEAVA